MATSPQSKERPILFSAPMVRAILEGRKTVTRREVKPQPPEGHKWRGWVVDSTCSREIGTASWGDGTGALQRNSVYARCPYGKHCDRLWVRETWGVISHDFDKHGNMIDWEPDRPASPIREMPFGQGYYSGHVIYRADGEAAWAGDDDGGGDDRSAWKPSIHMPRVASRILLEITDVRVERLLDISEDQAKAEGCFFTDYGQACFHGGRGIRDATECEYPASKHQQRPGWMWDKTNSHEQCLDSARHAFGNLWNSVGGDWGANPWVWVVEFKQVTP